MPCKCFLCHMPRFFQCPFFLANRFLDDLVLHVLFFWGLSTLACTVLLRSIHKCPMVLMSRACEGHGKTFLLVSIEFCGEEDFHRKCSRFSWWLSCTTTQESTKSSRRSFAVKMGVLICNPTSSSRRKFSQFSRPQLDLWCATLQTEETASWKHSDVFFLCQYQSAKQLLREARVCWLLV